MYQSEVFEKPWWRHPTKTRTTCVDCGRVVFKSREHATTRMLHIRRKYGGRIMVAYFRKECGWWHVRPLKRRRR